MLLKNKQDGSLVEVLDPQALIDPMKSKIMGKIQSGQEEQDPEEFTKDNLIFPSDENLPKCWLDVNYQSKN